MDNVQIAEQIVQGGVTYLRRLADAVHMEQVEEGICSLIRPKSGECGISIRFDFRVEGLTEAEIEEGLDRVFKAGGPIYWGNLPGPVMEKVNQRLASASGNRQGEEEEEANMALLPGQRISFPETCYPVSVRKVLHEADFKRWVDQSNRVMSGGFPVLHPDHHLHLWSSGALSCYSGYYGSSLAATAAILHHHGDDSLEFVSTEPEFRRKGLAQAACNRAIEDAFAAGARIITLRAASGSKKLYQSLGFQCY
ncbi:GNAT family N-acetyltransferase [Gorillibacterium sp. sgz500922]|uniref:GNAT family N-acetyltransferase n=1 Tax=Gorillibacterium sp. sgz500922 TaxID=3446694 RepID=UPI003F6737D7